MTSPTEPVLDMYSQSEYDAILSFYERRSRDVFQTAMIKSELDPCLNILPGCRMVQIRGFPFLESTLTVEDDVETPWLINTSRIYQYYDTFTKHIQAAQRPMSPLEFLLGLDPDTQFRVEFTKDTIESFFLHNQIPYLYPLPWRVLELQPDLPEIMYPGIKQGQEAGHWVTSKPIKYPYFTPLKSPRKMTT
jgi:hypothetical protein